MPERDKAPVLAGLAALLPFLPSAPPSERGDAGAERDAMWHLPSAAPSPGPVLPPAAIIG